MSIQETNLKAIADAIRAKTGETGVIVANDFASKIAAIQAGSKVKMLYVNEYRKLSCDIAYGDGKFVAVGTKISTPNANKYCLYYSDDADDLAWNYITPLSEYCWRAIAYGNGTFVALGGTGNSGAYSADGITWTMTTIPFGSVFWAGNVVYGNGKFVAVSQDNSTLDVMYSTDGITWTKTTTPFVSDGSSSGICIGYGGGKFVILMNNRSKAYYSTDGIAWTETTKPSSAWTSGIAYGNGRFVVTCGYGKMLWSEDGITWNECANPVNHSNCYWADIAYGDGKFVTMSGSDDLLAYSYDGVNWILKRDKIIRTSGYNHIRYGNSKFMISFNTTPPITLCLESSFFE